MDISVVIPTHNRAALLPRALDAVFAQTHPAREVIVVDDGSTDATADLIGARYPDVILLRQSQAGVSAARNAGIRRARSEWIALLDSDDAWTVDKLAAQCEALAGDPACRLIHCDETWLRNGHPLAQKKYHQKRGGNIFYDCLQRCVISPSAVMLHRSLLDAHSGFDESLPACEDYDLWLRITADEAVGFVPRALVIKHGGHADQLSRTTPALDRFRVWALTNLIHGGTLTPQQAAAARATLGQKLDVVVQGARKRGHLAEANDLENLRCQMQLT